MPCKENLLSYMPLNFYLLQWSLHNAESSLPEPPLKIYALMWAKFLEVKELKCPAEPYQISGHTINSHFSRIL